MATTPLVVMSCNGIHNLKIDDEWVAPGVHGTE